MTAQILDQPFGGIALTSPESRPPILLFPGDDMVRNLGAGFRSPFDSLQEYPSGLYLYPMERGGENSFEDETKFILPFKIGGRGYAKTSDLALIGEDTEADDAQPEDLHDQLYSPGYNPYIEMHEMQLYRVLENWADMVNDENWDVDKTGVVGGIERFREADTEEHWDKYVISQDW